MLLAVPDNSEFLFSCTLLINNPSLAVAKVSLVATSLITIYIECSNSKINFKDANCNRRLLEGVQVSEGIDFADKNARIVVSFGTRIAGREN